MNDQRINEIVHAKIPENIPTGDMPGDKINISEDVVKKAGLIFPELYRAVSDHPGNRRIVISVYGGSGSGKSTIASVLSYMLELSGTGSFIISGDNYPRRIPSANDNERLHIFRTGGIRSLTYDDTLTPSIVDKLRQLQTENRDFDKSLCPEYEWLSKYISGGTHALSSYLGTPEEIDFNEINGILDAFRKGDRFLWLKRMGRDEASIWYEKVDTSDKKALILEWTHGNSSFLKGVDIPVFLDSSPEETLKNRKIRGRDSNTDSPFTAIVLELEQKLLSSRSDRAAFIVRNGAVINCLKGEAANE